MSSPGVKADKNKVKKVKTELQLILWESVVGGRSDSRKKVLNLLADERYFNQNESLLDFTFQQANDCKELSGSSKLTVQDGFRYRKYSPLMVAVEEDNHDLAEELLKAKASVAFKNKERRNALLIACHKGFPRMTRLLLKALQEQWSTTALPRKPDCRQAINSKHKLNRWTPLMYAVLGGHMEVVEVLVENTHLRLKETNSKGQNVFHVAAREGKLECLKYLCGYEGREEEVLEAIKALDKRERNILHHVSTRGSLEVLEWLTEKFKVLLEEEKYMVQKSAIIKKKVKDENGQTSEVSSGEYTPFLVACEYKNLNIVKFFMEKFPVEKLMESTCYKDCAGISALHLAARHDDRDLFEFLLTKFAKYGAGSSSTEEAAVEDLEKIEKRILLDARDDKGDTVLHVARQSSSRGVAVLVLEKCSELESVKNKNGEVPSEEKAYFIPPEIIKMGKEAVAAYRKALEEGECKIPYWSMLILGEERVGKTSLYRQLVGKLYIKELDPTKGIDNNTVETADTRNIKLVGEDQSIWEEVTGVPSSSFTKALTEKAIEEMPEAEEEYESPFIARQEKLLLGKIEKLRKQLLPPSPPPASRNPPRLGRSAPSSSLYQVPPTTSRIVTPVYTGHSQSTDQPQQSITRSTIRESASSSQKREYVEFAKEVEVAPAPRHNVKESPPQVTSEELEAEETPSLSSSEPDSVLVTAPTPERRVDEKGLMNRRQGIFMAKKLRKRNKNEQNSFELTLNAWDFAGQVEYRPMHHCFISRRACYLVVFKIPDLLESACTHLEEIRYWIHSINAHIYPPEEELSEKDKTISRVLLVGTHKESCNMEELKKVDEILKELGDDKECCANHLIRPKSLIKANNYNYFIPVENSFDIKTKGSQYLKKSCTELVQGCIKKLSERLPFLKEDYPIKWLRFKETVEGIASRCPVITMERLESLAEESLIFSNDSKGQEVAIRFLHDSGKIICLKYLPSLFLKEDQREQLADKVIVSPRWMIKIMRKIVELDWIEEFHDDIQNAFLQELSCQGIADRHLLKERWSDELETCEILSFSHLCLILQAYCLIFPIHSQDKVKESAECSEKYLIPCKFPLRPTSVVSEEEYALYDFKVTFDFEKFLPSEVYHRLVCCLLMSAEREDNNVFSQEESIIHDVRDCDWRVEHKATEHVLEVSMKGCEGKVEDIVSLHGTMVRICKDSGLKGLRYVAGLWGSCMKCKEKSVRSREEKESLLICMKFRKGEGETLVQPNGDNCQCCKCKKKVNIYDCLKTTDGIPSDPCLTVDDLSDVLEEVVEARSKWHGIGLQLKLSPGTLDAIDADNKFSLEKCSKMLQKWLETGKVRTWRALAEALGSKVVAREDLKTNILKKYN